MSNTLVYCVQCNLEVPRTAYDMIAACRVSDVMTADPLVVRPETNIEAAARILLQKKVRRLPVVDDSGRLIGMFTRGDVIKAALRARKAALEKSMGKE